MSQSAHEAGILQRGASLNFVVASATAGWYASQRSRSTTDFNAIAHLGNRKRGLPKRKKGRSSKMDMNREGSVSEFKLPEDMERRCSTANNFSWHQNCRERKQTDGLYIAIRSAWAWMTSCMTLRTWKINNFERSRSLSSEVEERKKHEKRRRLDRNLGDLYTKSVQNLEGSFSAVSKPIFANKY